MSEAYEGVVFRSDEGAARRAFSSFGSSLRLRLVRLGREVFGIHRVAGRADAFDQPGVECVAGRVSTEVGESVALFYDDSCGVRVAVHYASGRRGREFGGGDEWWVTLDDAGEPLVGSPCFRVTELRPDEEYDCVYSAIDAGLEAIGVGSQVPTASVREAFCYGGAEVLAES